MARGGIRIGEVLKLKPGDIHDWKLILRDPGHRAPGSNHTAEFSIRFSQSSTCQMPGSLFEVRISQKYRMVFHSIIVIFGINSAKRGA
jgi:hypothetical protein